MIRIAWASTLIALTMATNALSQTAPQPLPPPVSQTRPPPPPSPPPSSGPVTVMVRPPKDGELQQMLLSLRRAIQEAPGPSEDQMKVMLDLLTQSLTAEEQHKITLVLDDLNRLPDEKRWILAASTNICAMRIIDCRNLPHDVVKPMVTIALEEQRAMRERADSQRNFYMSLGSFGISFASLIISFLAFRRKPEEPQGVYS